MPTSSKQPARSRRVPLVFLALAVLAMLLGACGGANEEGVAETTSKGSGDWSAQTLANEAQKTTTTAILVNSQVGVGSTRLTFGLFDKSQKLVTDAKDTKVRLFTLDGNSGTLVTEATLRPSVLPQENSTHQHADGTQHLHDSPEVTVYAAVVELTRPEWWGAEFSYAVGGKTQRQRLRFFVSPQTSEPGVGAPVPASVQKTLRDGMPITDLDTSEQPRPALHQMTIAEAVKSGKVSVIAFATPAFCQTRFCGPVVDSVVAPAAERYGDRVNVLHVEPFDVPAARSGTLNIEPVMLEWGLQTEPWVFVIGKDGRVAAKFEGILSLEELTAAIDKALATG